MDHGRPAPSGRRLRVLLALLASAWTGLGRSAAQETTELITLELPYPPYRPVEANHYSTRLGSTLRMRYDASLTAIVTDNRNYRPSGHRDADFGLRPTLTVGLFYPVSDRQKLQADVGIGYEWWAGTSDRNRLYIAPNSHLDYTFGLGEVDLRLSNHTASTSEASSRPEFAGGEDTFDIAFQQVANATGLRAFWGGARRISLSGGYRFAINRSLNDQFTSLDRDLHAFEGSAMVRITTPVAAGVSGSYSIFTFSEPTQNDGQSFAVGPHLTWRPIESLSLSALVQHAESWYDQTGSISDRSDFSGTIFNFAANHRLNRFVDHSASVGTSVDSGFGSNYTEDLSVRYALTARLNSRLTSSLGFRYRSISISGPGGDDADLYHLNLGVGLRTSSRSHLGASYAIHTRSARSSDRDYFENRFSLTASYRF
ncbi:MAG: hypothetical protein KF833_22175 [Verrucomicrobiae bacterium]|nr:hypothetical protein [Verrucomicrobiae bacterium]